MKKPVPFIKQKDAAERAIAELFGNTNVLRSATKQALIDLKEYTQSLIDALDADDADGVKDESQL